jgi:hypothetical protein
MCFFVWAFHTGAAPVHRAVFVFTSKQKVQPVDPRGLRFSAATPSSAVGRIQRGEPRTRATPPHLPIFLLRTCGPPSSRRDRRDPAGHAGDQAGGRQSDEASRARPGPAAGRLTSGTRSHACMSPPTAKLQQPDHVAARRMAPQAKDGKPSPTWMIFLDACTPITASVGCAASSLHAYSRS